MMPLGSQNGPLVCMVRYQSVTKVISKKLSEWLLGFGFPRGLFGNALRCQISKQFCILVAGRMIAEQTAMQLRLTHGELEDRIAWPAPASDQAIGWPIAAGQPDGRHGTV